ncbi:MAG: hypothetical protein U0169_15450 [Polyangiaceae bacterium]
MRSSSSFLRLLRRSSVVGALATLVCTFACSSTTSKDGTTGDGGDGEVDAGSSCKTGTSSDGPSADAFRAGAKNIVCYYASPSEGYCRKITDASALATYDGTNKGAIGCKDAIVVVDSECPTKNAVGKCTANSIEAERVYYACSKFPDPKAHCDQIQGQFAVSF